MGGSGSSQKGVLGVVGAGQQPGAKEANRMKPSLRKVVMTKGMSVSSRRYQMVWSLNPALPDRYHTEARFDKFRELDEVTKPVWSFDLAEHTMVLAAALADSNVHLWDLLCDPPELKVTLRPHDAHVWCVLFSPNELVLASASSDKTVRIWIAATGMPLQVLEAHTEGVRCLSFSQDGLLLSGGMDSQICLWEYGSSVASAQWKAHEGHVHSIAFVQRCFKRAKNPHLALSTGADGYICAWHVEQGAPQALGRFAAGAGKGVLCCAQSNVWDNWCASGHEDGSVLLWHFKPESPDWSTPMNESEKSQPVEIVCKLKLVGHKQGVRSLVFDHDGVLLASASTDGNIRVWDVRKMTKQDHEVVLVCIIPAHDSWVTQVRFEGGSRGICSCSADGLVKYWHAPARIRNLVPEFAPPEPKPHDKQPVVDEDPMGRDISVADWTNGQDMSQFSRAQLRQVGQLWSEADLDDSDFDDSEEYEEDEAAEDDAAALEDMFPGAPRSRHGAEAATRRPTPTSGGASPAILDAADAPGGVQPVASPMSTKRQPGTLMEGYAEGRIIGAPIRQTMPRALALNVAVVNAFQNAQAPTAEVGNSTVELAH